MLFRSPTNYFFVAVKRILFYILSIVTLIASPFLLITMSPEYSFWEFYQLPLIIYGIITFLFSLGFLIDVLRFGIPVIMKFGGLDFNDPKVREVYNDLKRTRKSFIKI